MRLAESLATPIHQSFNPERMHNIVFSFSFFPPRDFIGSLTPLIDIVRTDLYFREKMSSADVIYALPNV